MYFMFNLGRAGGANEATLPASQRVKFQKLYQGVPEVAHHI